jgi:hypothetical protein
MLKVCYFAVVSAMIACLFIALEPRAYAYVDPGSGLLLVQGLGTVLTGVLFALRRRIKSLFVSKKASEQ